MPRRGRARLLRRLKALTRPAWYHAHAVFTDRLVYVELDEVIGTPRRHGVAELIAQAGGASGAPTRRT